MENLYTTSRVYISRIIRARAFKRTRFGDRVSDVDKKNEEKTGRASVSLLRFELVVNRSSYERRLLVVVLLLLLLNGLFNN